MCLQVTRLQAGVATLCHVNGSAKKPERNHGTDSRRMTEGEGQRGSTLNLGAFPFSHSTNLLSTYYVPCPGYSSEQEGEIPALNGKPLKRVVQENDTTLSHFKNG